jgi:hypothetical protein
MNIIREINIFNWKKPQLSEFYLATVFGFFIFQLLKPLIFTIASWSLAAVRTVFSLRINEADSVWYCLILVCFLLVILLKVYIIRPLGLKIDYNSSGAWETVISFVVIFGFYLYIINKIFLTVPMPKDSPLWLIRVLDAWENNFITNSSVTVYERNFWAIVPFIWILAPLVIFYYPIIKKGFSSPSSSSEPAKK